jgi:hypothetical protein
MWDRSETLSKRPEQNIVAPVSAEYMKWRKTRKFPPKHGAEYMNGIGKLAIGPIIGSSTIDKTLADMQTPRLFGKLPDYVATPDGMAIDSEGNLILACPNYANPSLPGCLLKIDENRLLRKWVDVPVSEETGHAFPMGIAFGPDWDLYICDNQGWSGAPSWCSKVASCAYASAMTRW